MIPWPEERLARLVTLVEEGCTAQQIANVLGAGLTRSAVVGMIYRTPGLQLKGSPGCHNGAAKVSAASPAARTERRLAARRRGPGAGAVIVEVEDPVYVEPEVFTRPPPATARPWLQRVDCECAFPVAGDGAGTLFCCAPAERKGYCSEHAVVLYGKARRAA